MVTIHMGSTGGAGCLEPAEEIRVRWLAGHSDPDWLRCSAYVRLQARMASMPVIEQAKGIFMAQWGGPRNRRLMPSAGLPSGRM